MIKEQNRPTIYKLKLTPYIDGEPSPYAMRAQLAKINRLPIIAVTKVRLEVDIRIFLPFVCPADGDLLKPESKLRIAEAQAIEDKYYEFMVAALVLVMKLKTLKHLKIWITSPQKKAYELVQWDLQDRVVKRLNALRMSSLKEAIVVVHEAGEQMPELFKWPATNEMITRSEYMERLDEIAHQSGSVPGTHWYPPPGSHGH